MRALISIALIAAATAYAHPRHQHHPRHHAAIAVAQQEEEELDRRGRGDPYPNGPGYDAPPLEQITAITTGPPGEPTVPLPEVFSPGATNTLANAPPLPTSNLDLSQYPPGWDIPDVNSPQVQEWMKELDGHDIPGLSQTINDPNLNDPCNTNPQISDADRGASGRCWWTCGGCTRDTDITTCSDKMNWGLTFDDGPGEFTPKLLTYLDSQSILATFYLVGSNVIARPETVQSEYMIGHELSIHTWSHPALTSLTNAQIVAELGWTRKAIKDVTGVTPRTFRPPFGDIDDRVRAIGAAMGLTPVIWTGVDDHNGGEILFDSQDWRVHGGGIKSTEAKAQLAQALDLAPTLDHGVIVLEHDVYPETVNLAIISTIPDALQRGFTLQPVATCLRRPMSDAYLETSGSTGPLPASGGNSTTNPPANKPSGSGSTGSQPSASKTAATTPSGRPSGTSSSTSSNPSQTGAAVARYPVADFIAFAAAAVAGIAVF